MNGLIIGVYGLYLVLVGVNGNAGSLVGKVQADAPKFLPWIIAIFVLAFLHGSSDTGKKITTPFLLLLILSFVLKRFDTLKSQSEQLWNMAATAAASGGSSSGDKVAPAGTVNKSSQVPLNSSPSMNSLIGSLGNIATFSGLE